MGGGRYRWVVAWGVSVVLACNQTHGTALLFEALMLLLLAGLLLFLIERASVVLAGAVAEALGLVVAAPCARGVAHPRETRVLYQDAPLLPLSFQRPPPHSL